MFLSECKFAKAKVRNLMFDISKKKKKQQGIIILFFISENQK